jgi:clan AA aspartic protease (TIGR02281 family)
LGIYVADSQLGYWRVSFWRARHLYVYALHMPWGDSWPYYVWTGTMLLGLLWVVIGVRRSRAPRKPMTACWALAWAILGGAALWNQWYIDDWLVVNWFLTGLYLMTLTGALMLFWLAVRGIGSGAVGRNLRRRLPSATRTSLGLGFGIAVVAAIRSLPVSGDSSRPNDDVSPSLEGRTLTIPADQWGQFWASCRANDIDPGGPCLVDTGAYGSFTVGRQTAAKIGLELSQLNFNGWSWTANGAVHTASAHIATLQVGPFVLHNVPVVVNDSEMDHPLVGMGFLRRYKMAAGGDTLTITE